MKVSDYHKQGYNCAEAMIKAYNEEHGTNIPVSLGSGMGSGFTSGSLCGAISAATMIIGYLKGREEDTPYFIKQIDGEWKYVAGNVIPTTVTRVGEKVGRNDSCPCGSGKKYKKCCGASEA